LDTNQSESRPASRFNLSWQSIWSAFRDTTAGSHLLINAIVFEHAHRHRAKFAASAQDNSDVISIPRSEVTNLQIKREARK
jgi:hypothetical protein